MQDISYTVSPTIKNEIEKIDQVRNRILTILISRGSEQLARWDANSARTTFASRLTDRKLKSADVQGIVNPFETKKKADPETEGYFKAYLLIDKIWFLNKDKLKLADLKKLLKLIYSKHKVNDNDLEAMLDFVQTTPEHPLIEAALFFYLSYKVIGQSKDIKTSTILSNIFLYKSGYDMRGMLNLEEIFANDHDNLERMLNDNSQGSVSNFLEYFVMSVSMQSEKAYTKLSTYKREVINSDTLFKLGTRDIQIMTLFDKPGAKITNKNIQKEFGISQITASRDLARLALLNLIVRRGKGRSIYYTRF